MRYDQAVRLKRYLLDNYGSDKCAIRIHCLNKDDLKYYRERNAKFYGVHTIRIHILIDDSISEYGCITKYTLKSMRSLMLDCKNGLY